MLTTNQQTPRSAISAIIRRGLFIHRPIHIPTRGWAPLPSPTTTARMGKPFCRIAVSRYNEQRCNEFIIRGGDSRVGIVTVLQGFQGWQHNCIGLSIAFAAPTTFYACPVYANTPTVLAYMEWRLDGIESFNWLGEKHCRTVVEFSPTNPEVIHFAHLPYGSIAK